MKLTSALALALFLSSCGGKPPVCRNGAAEDGEECDDGNDNDADGCNTNCELPRCGNTLTDEGEQCDDGNASNDDGCSADCRLEFCGDGVEQGTLGEQCDDQDANNNDLCIQCKEAFCGDGFVFNQEGGTEACDDGKHCQDATPCTEDSECAGIGDSLCRPRSNDACPSSCLSEGCGDGFTDSALNELCDDGNLATGDGCNSCQAEAGHFFELEVNNAIAEPNDPPSGNIIVHGSLKPITDVDVYSILIESTSDLRLETVDGNPSLNSCANAMNTTLRFIDTDRVTEIDRDDVSGIAACSLLTPEAPQNDTKMRRLIPGLYFVSVEDQGNNEELDKYQLLVSFIAVCGDAATTGSEECDDGNTISGDGCTFDCLSENDAPVNIVPGAQSTNEDVAILFSSGTLAVSDADAGSEVVQVSLGSTNGTITLSGVAGLTFTAGDGSSDAAMTFTGTVANINTALNGMSFIPTANFNGSGSITITTNDQGNTGIGGALSDSDTIPITINAVNDTPVNTVPGAQSTNEDTTRVFNAANSNLISIADLDAANNPTRVTLTATTGSVSLSGTSGLSFTAGDGSADATMTFTGTLTSINTALNGLSFIPTPNANGAASLSITTNDQGFVGSGGALSDADTIAITITAVNDGPTNTVPAAQTTNEDVAKVFNSANGNTLSIADADSAASSVQLVLTATNGAVSLSGVTGLSFTVGDGTADAAMTFTGTVTNINSALNSMSFLPSANFNGAASLSITTNDQGNTGGGALSDADTVAITVNAINDGPVNTVPAAQTTNEDVAKVFNSANGNTLSIADADSASNSIQATLSVTNGTLTLSSTSGLSFSAGDGTADATMTFTGTLSNINSRIGNFTFTPDANFNGAASITLTSNDLGSVGAGGALSDTDTVNITVNAVNDAPVNTTPSAPPHIPPPPPPGVLLPPPVILGLQVTNMNTDIIFSNANVNLIAVSDIDAGTLSVSLDATDGSLTLSGVSGLSFSVGDGTSDATMTFTGTTANVNAALAGLRYTPTTNFKGFTDLSITTNDLGNTGSGGALSDTDVIDINVGSGPTDSATGDFNGDGRDDAIVLNEGSNNITVLLGNTGGLIIDESINAGTRPVAVAVGDFNGDGRSDAIVVNQESNNVTVFTGNTGGLSAGVNISVGILPFSVAVGNFNGDTRDDAIVANFGSNNATVLLGSSSGLTSGSNINVGTSPIAVTTGDFVGGNDIDAIIVNKGTNNVTVLIGSTGGLSFNTTITVGTSPKAIAAGDFDGDGDKDALVLNQGNATLLSQGTSFLSTTNIGVIGSSVVIGNFNGDSREDAVVVTGSGVTVFSGITTGLSSGVNINIAGTLPAAAVGRFDTNAFDDVVVVNYTSNNVAVLLGSASGLNFDENISIGVAPTCVAIGNFDGISGDDAIVGLPFLFEVGVLLGNSGGLLLDEILSISF